MNNTNQKRTITLYGKKVKLWSKEKDTELIELKKEGKDIYYISDHLGRTTNAIKKRINNRHFYKTYKNTNKNDYRGFLDL
jgi:23S rRNA maturation mini-RNase III